MDEVALKVDSKGRLCIPAEISEEIGKTAILKKTSEGYLIIPGQETDFQEKFRRIITAKHRRTGKPENWSPEKMKSIWSKNQE
jgi:DNA-binding transcriptional regulator/RsmH inhibitor MraZ